MQGCMPSAAVTWSAPAYLTRTDCVDPIMCMCPSTAGHRSTSQDLRRALCHFALPPEEDNLHKALIVKRTTPFAWTLNLQDRYDLTITVMMPVAC